MKYAKKILQPGETLRHVSRIHWIIYLRGILLLLVGAAILVWLETTWADVLALAFVALGIILVGLAWLRRSTTEVAVSNRRIIYKRGIFSRHTMEMNLAKVESVDVDQSVLGRILGYGTIRVRGTGSGIEALRRIDTPIKFRNCITAR